MFKSLTVLAFAAGSAMAQGSSTNPLIPSGISKSCSDFIVQLNGNKDLSACFSSIISATSAYGAGSNATYTKSSVTSTLDTLCAPQNESKCPQSAIRGQLTDFYMACADELTTSPNKDVVSLYETLYSLPAFKSVICTKDDSGKYCALTDRGAGKVSLTQRGLEARAPAIVPNLKAFSDSNLIFLFLKPSLPKEALCVPCTKNIITAWFNVESQIPFAPGYETESLLSQQPPLVSAITAACGENFFSGNVAAAAGLGNSGSPFGNDNAAAKTNAAQGFVVAVLGAITFVAASTL